MGRRIGDAPLSEQQVEAILNRLVSKIDFTGDCWVWTGARYPLGYGSFEVQGIHSRSAHRIAYQLIAGPIPDGLELDHLCMNPPCVNPDHLEPVTHYENSRRWAASITACPQGHPYDETNTSYGAKGERRCRACHRDKERAARARKRQPVEEV